jgi:hypothetical protein
MNQFVMSRSKKKQQQQPRGGRVCLRWMIFVFVVGSYWMLVQVGLEERRVRAQIFSEKQSQPQWNSSNSSSSSMEPSSPSSSSWFGACLLVMDDNHFLIEWLAFHYHVLPLRQLIIAIDPRSRTNPESILDRWKDLIDITIWKDASHILHNDTEVREAEEWVRLKFAADAPSPHLIRHRARQRLFYYHCLQQYKQQQHLSYVLLTDTDEYISINYPTLIHMYGTEVADAVPITEPGSVLKLLNYHRNMYPDSNLTSSSCIQIPRLRYGTVETTTTDNNYSQPLLPTSLQTSLNGSHFATLRWHHHANFENYQQNRISKTIIDVSQIDIRHIRPVDSIHRPVRKYCGRRKLHIRPNQQILLIHHYLGTYQQYAARENDARRSGGQERSIEMFQTTSRLHQASNHMVVGWLQGLEQSLGTEKTLFLLQNVGQVE